MVMWQFDCFDWVNWSAHGKWKWADLPIHWLARDLAGGLMAAIV